MNIVLGTALDLLFYKRDETVFYSARTFLQLHREAFQQKGVPEAIPGMRRRRIWFHRSVRVERVPATTDREGREAVGG